MANIHPEIKPNAVMDKYLIDLMYMLQQSLYGACAKLDADASAGTGYVAACYTAIFREQIWDYRGNKTQNVTNCDHIVMPSGGLPAGVLCQWLYDWANAFETLCTAADADGLNTSDYETKDYYGMLLPYQFEDKLGTIIGNDNTSGGFSTSPDSGAAPWLLTKIGPTGKPNDRILCDLCYDMIAAWEQFLEHLDTDGATTPPTDTNYEALWYTATVLMKVENSAGSVIGNAQTRLG